MSLRKLKHHEQKLLKRVDFLRWKTDDTMREAQIMRRYHIEQREEYVAYNKICGKVHALVHRLKSLDPADPFRIKMTDMLLQKL
jgi:U3 small nucleolar ribonucleoprotein protein IMP3